MDKKAISWLRDNLQWALSLAAFVSAATAGWVHLEARLTDQDRQLRNLNEAVRCGFSVGPSGFLDPAAHSAHDTHIERWHEEVFGRRGWRELQRKYTDNGGPLPKE